MAGPGAFDAQRAVRMGAEELQDYMADLFRWSKDAKRRGAAAAAAPAPTSAQQPAAAQQPASQQRPASSSGAARQRHPAAHTYEHYREKWDRFDVDAELAAADGPAGGGSSSTSASTQQQQRQQQRGASPASASTVIPQARVTVPVAPSKPPPATAAPKQAAAQRPAAATAGAPEPSTAEGWKEAGNAHFRAGRHERAAECYGRALALAPGCIPHANRAMALLKLGRAAEAEADCTTALGHDPLYVKAWLRRATARRQQGRLLEAAEDCEAALRLEPQNKQAAAERAELVTALLRQEGLQPPAHFKPLQVVLPGGVGESVAAAAAEAAPAAAPAAPEPGLAAAAQPAAEPQPMIVEEVPAPPAAAAAVAPAAADGLVAVSSSRLKPQPPAAPAADKQQGQQQGQPQVAAVHIVSRISDGDEAVPALEESPPQLVQQQQEPAQPQPVQPPLPTEPPQPPAPAEQQRRRQQQQPAAVRASTPPAVAAAAPAGAAVPTAFKLPRTGVEFEKAWRGLKGGRQQQAAYLLALPPAQLPALLRQALTPGLLAAATAALLRPALQQQPGPAVALLEALAAVPRFDLNLLSVPPRQRAELAAEWDAAAAVLGAGDAALAERLAAARRLYKL